MQVGGVNNKLPQIIGIHGKARHGKSTVGNYIADAIGGNLVACIAFADPLKQFCQEVFGWNQAHIEGQLKEVTDSRYGITPRRAMQLLGTEWGRACYENIWVEYGLRRARQLLDSIILHEVTHGANTANTYMEFPSHVCITDVRFPNEVKAVSEVGLVIKVDRPGYDEQYKTASSSTAHASETAMDEEDLSPYIGYTIINDSDLIGLRSKVSDMLVSFR